MTRCAGLRSDCEPDSKLARPAAYGERQDTSNFNHRDGQCDCPETAEYQCV